MEKKTTTKQNSTIFKRNIGFVFAGITALTVLIDIFTQSSYSYGTVSPTWSNIFRLGFIVYYCLLIARIHKIAAEKSDGQYPITPGKAVGFLFIPLFNFYWLFKWQLEISKFINSKFETEKIKTGSVVGLLIGGLVVQFIPLPVDGNKYWIFGLAMLFIFIHLAYKFFDSLNEIDKTREAAVKTENNFNKMTFVETDFKNQFILANIIGFGSFALLDFISGLLFHLPLSLWLTFKFESFFLPNLIIMLIAGALLGFSQWAVLKKYNPKPEWALFTMAGFVLYAVVSGLINSKYHYIPLTEYFGLNYMSIIFVPVFTILALFLLLPNLKESINGLLLNYLLPWVLANLIIDLLYFLIYYADFTYPGSFLFMIINLLLMVGKGIVIGIFLGKFFIEKGFNQTE
jgi:hypothetical protein